MSVRVDPNELGEQLGVYGRAPFLVTTAADLRPHTTHVVVEFRDGTLAAQVGRKTAANVAAHPLVSLLWPAIEPGGYSLIVDGAATAMTDAANETHSVHIEVTAAVLHRNAQPAGYQADCQPLDGR